MTDDPPCLLRTLRPRRSIAGEFEDEAEGERTPWNFEAGNCDVTRQALIAVKTAANENTRLYRHVSQLEALDVDAVERPRFSL